MTKPLKYDIILRMEKIRDLVRENLKKETKYSDRTVDNVMERLERIPIKKSRLFAKFLYKSFDQAGIIFIGELLDLTLEQAMEILGLNKTMMKNYIKEMNKKVVEAAKTRQKNIKNKKKAIEIEPLAEIIIKNIKYDPHVLELLKKEMMYKEEYNNEPLEIQRRNRPFYYCNLNLNNDEISVLRGLLLGKLKYDTTDRKFNAAIIKISDELHFFIRKLQYKSTINKNYIDLEEINLTSNDIRILDRVGITTVSDLIELNNLKKERHTLNSLDKKIKDALAEVGIIIPDNKEEVEELLELENAGIIRQKTKRIVK